MDVSHRPFPSTAGPTSVAEQSVEQLGGPRSVLVRQRADHAVLDRLLDEAARTSGAEQDEVLTRLARLVFPHAYAEETVLWPVVRAALPDGEQITLRNEHEHQEINELFSDLDRTPPGPDRDELLGRTADVLRQDARDEEDLILPRLRPPSAPRSCAGSAWRGSWSAGPPRRARTPWCPAARRATCCPGSR
jgi:hemerythrin superfamily protein